MDMFVCRTTHQSVCQSTRKSVALSVCTTASPSIIPIRPSYAQSVHHPVNSSMTRQSITPPVSPEICPSGCPTSSDHSSNLYTCPSDCPSMPDHLYNDPLSPSACPSPSDCLTTTMARLPVHPSSNMIQLTQDSSQSLAVMNGEQSCKAKTFRRVFTNYDLPLCALDVSSIYLSAS